MNYEGKRYKPQYVMLTTDKTMRIRFLGNFLDSHEFPDVVVGERG